MPQVRIITKNFMDMVASLLAFKLERPYENHFICEAILRYSTSGVLHIIFATHQIHHKIKKTCKKHGVDVTGQNSASGVDSATHQIQNNLNEEDGVVDQFIYQRIGADFFSPKQFPVFAELVRGLNQPEPHIDDLPEKSSSNLYARAA